MVELSAHLTVPEWDYVINVLRTRPHSEVDALFQKLRSQLEGQPTALKPADKEKEDATPASTSTPAPAPGR